MYQIALQGTYSDKTTDVIQTSACVILGTVGHRHDASKVEEEEDEKGHSLGDLSAYGDVLHVHMDAPDRASARFAVPQ